MAKWLEKQELDSPCAGLLEIAREIYKAFLINSKDLPTAKYKNEHRDAGGWQVKK